MKNLPVVIFHKNCIDGFSGATVAFMAGIVKTAKQLYFDVPTAARPPPHTSGKDVFVIDVAYSKDVLFELAKEAKSVVFIDHHLTTGEIIKEKLPTNLKIVYDSAMCGSMNAWNYFFGSKSPPLALKYVNDNDIGKWEYDYTLPFISSIEVLMPIELSMDALKKWRTMMRNPKLVKKMIKRGMVYEEYKNYLINVHKDRYTLASFPGPNVSEVKKQYTVAVLNVPCPSVSAVGTAVLKSVDCDFVAIWVYSLRDDTYNISFRSKSTDVNAIANAFGGGGHRLAAACRIPGSKYSITDLFVPITH